MSRIILLLIIYLCVVRFVSVNENENDSDVTYVEHGKSCAGEHIDHVIGAGNGLSAAEFDETLRSMKLELHKDLDELLNGKTNGDKALGVVLVKLAETCNKTSQLLDDQRKNPSISRTPKINPRSLAPVRKNSLNLIVNSTICVFQWNKSWYRCFVCTEAFPDVGLLREHFSKHSLSEYEARIISQQNRLIKVEVSQLSCKLCQTDLANLNELLKHLEGVHSIPFHGSEHLLVPFKITTPLKCLLCGEVHDSFRLLNIHVNKHYTRHVCDTCGTTFSSRAFLNLHRSRAHREWRCEKCHLAFETRAAKTSHDRSEHGSQRKERFPCPKCESRFSQEVHRARHLVEEHGAPRPEHRCELCEKAFITRGLRNAHMSRTHRKERTQSCDLCARLFYSRSDVTRHRVTHTGERQFECEMCGSAFATKGSLRRHVGRSHPPPKSTPTS